MSKAATCELVQGATRIVIEYIRARGVLRLTGNPRTHSQWGPMEMSFVDMVKLLRIDVSAVAPDLPFLLFAGNGCLGGSKDFVGAFETEVEARAQFVGLRHGSASWAEVVILTRGKLRQVCWFGSPDGAPRRRRRWRR